MHIYAYLKSSPLICNTDLIFREKKKHFKELFKKKKKVPLHFIKSEKLWNLSSSSLKSPAQSNILSCISIVSNVCFCNKTILTLWDSQLYRSNQLTKSFAWAFQQCSRKKKIWKARQGQESHGIQTTRMDMAEKKLDSWSYRIMVCNLIHFPKLGRLKLVSV